MNYAAACHFLFSLNKIARREYLKNPRSAGIYLKRLQALLDILGNPEKKTPHYIHVTGTSGKGSVCHMLYQMLRASGKKCALLTSPGLDPLLTRFEINGRNMSQKNLIALVAKLQPALEQCLRTSPYDLPSYFETLTALGLLYFAEQQVEWAVIEVYVGGKNDATNIIPYKDVAIITNIGRDHLDLIGPSKREVAKEKAGIIRARAPVLTQEKNPLIRKIIGQTCRRVGATLTYIPTPRLTITDSLAGSNFDYNGVTYFVPGIGQHQVHNAILAIEAGKMVGLSSSAIKKGLSQTRLPIRLEVIAHKPLIILDGAHNQDKIKAAVAATRRYCKKKNRLHLVIGFSADKNIRAMLKELAILEPATIAATRFSQNMFRTAANPRTLGRWCQLLMPQAKTTLFLEPKEALDWSRKKAGKNDIVLVTGSIFLATELRPFLWSQANQNE